MSSCSTRTLTLYLITVLVSVLLPLNAAFAGPVRILAPVTDADGRLGLCDVLPGSIPGGSATTWAQLAYNAGARINRWEFRWDRIERKKDSWNFSTDDQAVQSSVGSGLDILGILIGTPGWAVSPPGKPGNGLPLGLDLPIDNGGNLWAQYVRQTVLHYKGRVRYWEAWNEPDLQFFWSSSADDYFQLLKTTYLVVKAVDPAAKVLMAGMVVPDLGFLARVLDDAKHDTGPKGKPYFDSLAWHIYGSARSAYTNTVRVKTLLVSHGFASIPVWVTEDGFPSSNPNGEPRQAAYVLQTIAYALAAGASKILVYRASDDTTPKTWGLLASTGTPRMGYVAFQVAAHYFAHTQAVMYAPNADLERFTFYIDGERVIVLWTRNKDGRTVLFPADQPTATLVDWLGNTTTLTADNGLFHIQIPGAPYNAGVDPAGTVVAGQPVLLIQDNSEPVGLSSSTYLSGASQPQSSVAIFNPLETSVTARVAAAAHRHEYGVMQLPPRSIRSVDVRLLAGQSYEGIIALSSSDALSMQADSNGSNASSRQPSEIWTVPVSPRSFAVGNVSANDTTVDVSAYGIRGLLRLHQTFRLAALHRTIWTLPQPIATMRLALRIHANEPIVIGAAGASPAASTSWYALKPGTARVTIYNANATNTASVSVRFIGSGTVQGVQFRLAPYQSFVFPSHGADAILVDADRPVVSGYADNPNTPASMTPHAQTTMALVAAGSTTDVNIFNPGKQVAHVTMSVVDGTSTRTATTQLPASGSFTLHVRKLSESIRGVIVDSDIPVVSSTGTQAAFR